MKIVKSLSVISFIFFILLSSSFASASVHVAPVMRKSPADLTYVVGTSGNVLIWAFDAHESADSPSKYVVTIDDNVVAAHNFTLWSDNVDITVNVDGLAMGNHMVKIVANDTGTDNNQATATTDTAVVSVVSEIMGGDQTSDTTSDSITSTTSDAITSSDTTPDTTTPETTTTPTTETTTTVDSQSSNSGTSEVNAFPITFLSLIFALAIGIPILKYQKY